MGERDVPEIELFAREEGLEVIDGDIFLPLGQVNKIEYGICFDATGLRSYVWNKDDCKLIRGAGLACYTSEMVIRTVEFQNKKYAIERKKGESAEKQRALILAYKFRDLGTLDTSFVCMFYKQVIAMLPTDIAEEFLENKLSELEEKIEEIFAMHSEFPRDDYYKIMNNLLTEYINYTHDFVVDVSGLRHRSKNILLWETFTKHGKKMYKIVAAINRKDPDFPLKVNLYASWGMVKRDANLRELLDHFKYVQLPLDNFK